MASLPVQGVSYTNPTLVQTLSAFFIGNLFANFLFVVGALVAIFRYFNAGYALLGVVVAYYALIFSSNAHNDGGMAALRPYLLPLLSHLGEYFGLKEKYEGGLTEGGKYVFACHPHGIHGFGTGIFMHDGPSSKFYQAFPFLRGKVVGLVARVMFFIPLVRELFLMMGARDASAHVARAILAEHKSLYIIVGGEAESLLSVPGVDEVVAAGPRRKGFVKLALGAGAELVPVYMVSCVIVSCLLESLLSHPCAPSLSSSPHAVSQHGHLQRLPLHV